MSQIQIVDYYIPDIFEKLPKYTATKTDTSSIRLEWELYYYDDLKLERWAEITYYKENSSLFITCAYGNFQFKVSDFTSFFKLYFSDIKEFVEPLNKRLSPDLDESLKLWDSIAGDYYVEQKLSLEEYTDVLNFFREKCYIKAPQIVIENAMMESPILNSLFRKPVELFPLLYGYPFCTKFLLRYLMPILCKVIIDDKLLN